MIPKNNPIFETETTEVPEQAWPESRQENLLVPEYVWRNTVINFDRINHAERRALKRVPCYGEVVFFNSKGRIVAKGRMRDLNEKSGGFEIKVNDLNLNDYFTLEFLDSEHFLLTQVKVVLRRIQLAGTKLRVGVEFVNATPVFQERLSNFLRERRSALDGFNELETI